MSVWTCLSKIKKERDVCVDAMLMDSVVFS